MLTDTQLRILEKAAEVLEKMNNATINNVWSEVALVTNEMAEDLRTVANTVRDYQEQLANTDEFWS